MQQPFKEEPINPSAHWLVSLADLDDEQKYIAALRPQESYIVEGCAGSGKSVLSMIKFNQLCAMGQEPIYATMMRGLTDTIISEVLQSSDVGMASAREYISKTTNKVELPNDAHGKAWYYSSSSVGTCATLPCLQSDKFSTRGQLKGNSLVLDECQDIAYQDLLSIVQSRAYNPICWYGDDDQQLCEGFISDQKHVRLRDVFDVCFPGEEETEKWFRLSNNYRISRHVARFIDEFQKVVPGDRKPLALYARGRHTDKPYLCGFTSQEKEIDTLVEIITNRQWHKRIGHTTAILVGGSNAQVEDLYKLIKQKFESAGYPQADVQRRHGATKARAKDWVTADPNAPIVISTPIQSKGCQFDTVFVLADTFGKNNGHHLEAHDLNGIHVAMTRSGGELFIFYVGSIPPAFDQIPLSLYKSSVVDKQESATELGLD